MNLVSLNLSGLRLLFGRVVLIWMLCGTVLVRADDAAGTGSEKPWIGGAVAQHVVVGSSPDNTYELLRSFYSSAQRSIKISVYQLDNVFVGDVLEEALARGVTVELLLEGGPIPRIPTSELYIVSRLIERGAKVYFYDLAKGRNNREFKYFHNKYGIVDGQRVIVGSANYGNSGHPVVATAGNREWEVVLEGADIAKRFEASFAHDKALDEWAQYGSKPQYTFNDPKFKPDRTGSDGKYELGLELAQDNNVTVQTVFAPDNALSQDGAILGTLKGATTSILVEQLNFETYWGEKNYNPERQDSPMMTLILAAARAGKAVRLLLNDDFIFRGPDKMTAFELFFSFGAEGDTSAKEERDNRATVDYLKRIARREGLDLGARLLDFKRCGLGVLHNKGMVVDGKKVLVGSLNWGESALKFNREAGVVLDSRAVASYYNEAFNYDWNCSR